jgi:Transcription-repair coupling factor (superfamily II helicase)
LSKIILSQKFQQSLVHQNLSVALSKSKEKTHLKGALGSSLSFTIASIFKTINQPFLLIFDTKEEAAYYLNDLEVLLDDKEFCFIQEVIAALSD